MLNEKKTNSLSIKDSDELLHKEVATSNGATGNRTKLDDGETSTDSTKNKSSLSESFSTVRDIFNASKCEDDIAFRIMPAKDLELKDKEPMFVIVDSSCVSNPSSQEILVENRKGTILKKHNKNFVIPEGIPSTSRDITNEPIIQPHLDESVSSNELQMIEINLQSENAIPVNSNEESDTESIVISYLQNKELYLDSIDSTLISTRRMSSILEDLPKMETIVEELSENSLDVHIPSFPGSPRSVATVSSSSIDESHNKDNDSENETHKVLLNQAVERIQHLQEDNIYLESAEMGDSQMIEEILERNKTNIHQVDHLGRNALHLAICSEDEPTIVLLLKAGVNPNVKDKVGMTPLSLCLMRCPSVRVVNLLFNHGAKLLPRTAVMDTGLFMQFAMMCGPDEEDEKILHLLASKGCAIDDPLAPGGRQALHFAAMSNNCKLVEILVDLGANLYATDARGKTPREVASIFKCREASLLLEKLEKIFSGSTLSIITTSLSDTTVSDKSLVSLNSSGALEADKDDKTTQSSSKNATVLYYRHPLNNLFNKALDGQY